MIRVENISKLYRIGAKTERATTIGEAVGSLLISPLRNLRKLRGLTSFRGDDESDVILALKDVSFEVEQGEVVGFIGRNGAGKSTLLKVLSRITPPSSGRISIDGRVSSLLEVGTGFHPELTGRENIYLNGTILGMRKREVDKLFDEIVDFSGVEKFIETPVKRYSSGMSVRLAFAVAAHLEPEVLIIDEVLAVGDQDFQDKCIGKMSKVAQSGRTVLFVSHNLAAVQSLCKRAILIESGEIIADEDSATTISQYLNTKKCEVSHTWRSTSKQTGDNEIRLLLIRAYQELGESEVLGGYSSLRSIYIEIEFEAFYVNKNLCIGFDVTDKSGLLLFRSFHTDSAQEKWPEVHIGVNRLRATMDASMLNSGVYYISPRIGVHNEYWIVNSDPLISFSVIAEHAQSRLWSSSNANIKPGCIAPLLDWCKLNSGE